MNQVTAWALILGAITPLLVSVVNNPKWSPMQKRITMLGISLAVGLVNVIVQGAIVDWTLSVGNVVVIVATVIGAAQTAYALLWKPSGVSDKVESATSKQDVDLAA